MLYPKSNNWIGFIISTSEVSIYHSGDIDLIPEMNDLKADIALLPVSGNIMNVRHAISAVKIIKPKIAIPMHYDASLSKYYKIFPGVGNKDDAEKFCEGIKSFCNPIMLEKLIPILYKSEGPNVFQLFLKIKNYLPKCNDME